VSLVADIISRKSLLALRDYKIGIKLVLINKLEVFPKMVYKNGFSRSHRGIECPSWIYPELLEEFLSLITEPKTPARPTLVKM